MGGVDDEGVERDGSGLELQAELFLDGGEDAEAAGLRIGCHAELRSGFDVELVGSGEAGLIDDGAV